MRANRICEMNEIEWHKLTSRCLPPKSETFLLWMGLSDSDGGFPAVARLGYDQSRAPYVMFHGAKDGWKVFFHCEWQGMMWATIPIPEQARRKREKTV